MRHEIKHHPDDATIVSYAAGTLTEALSAIVAAHISMCPRCRDEVKDLELLGATLMLSTNDIGSPLAVPTAPETVVVAQPKLETANSGLPIPIARAYGLSAAAIPWKRLGPGIWHHRLALNPGVTGDLRLLRIGPGRRMPDHGHGGAELTLVIDGAYSDVTGIYRRGDIQDLDESIEHQPIVDQAAPCVCLIASEHPARFKGLFSRLFQPWTGM